MPKQVIMPKFGMDQETGTVVAWLRQEGEQVEKGEPILEVETDKVNMEVEAPASGILQGIRVGPGITVPIGDVIAYILKPGETLPDPPDRQPTNQEARPAPGHSAPKLTPVAQQMVEQYGVDADAIPAAGPRITKSDVEAHIARLLAQRPPAPAPDSRLRAAPAARRLARELGVDLADVRGSGPEGRIQSRDVTAAAQTAPAVPTAPPSEPLAVARRIPLTAMRRAIARRLTASVQQIPQFNVSLHVNMERALQIVADLRGDATASTSPKVTVTAILIKACAWTLARQPQVNASFGGEEIIEWGEINIGVAVALEAGLVTPVIHHADRRSLTEIAGVLADLAERARARSLKAEELQGGTFTISNLGMVGIERFTAIIDPPQAAILAVGRTQPQPVVDENGQIVVQPLVDFTLTADHRIIDGALAGRFLTDLKGVLEHPGRLWAGNMSEDTDNERRK